ncbi:unnamed protein product [Trifolium pratense]|uniref:Uncharacterized protein n=1 Tax=Trifolium pratense TaxID=57577 RepID=A0ACB0K406_TRIPR|nr:unnamed protein product [Trifolium pratense]
MRKIFKAKSNGIKLEVTWNNRGQSIGRNSIYLSSYIDLTARRIVPIYFDRWNAKDETVRPAYDAYKKDIWDEIRSAFEIGDEHYDYVMTIAGTCLRAFRTKLTTEYLRDGDGNVIRQRPSKYSHVIEQEHWDIFVAKRETEEFQKISKENRERALNPQHPYKKGRLGYARLEDDMIIPRVNVWVSARVGKDGEIDENVQSVKDKCDELTQSLTEEEEQDLAPTDTLFKALDLPEYSSRVRSYGKGVTRKRLYAPRSNITQAQVNEIKAKLERLEKLHANEITGRQQPEKMAERQQPEKMVERQKQPEEVLERPHPKGISSINIYLGFPSRRLVARGKLHNTEGDMVHDIKLPLGYVKVAIDVSVISDAPLPISIEYGEVSTVGQAIGTIVPWPFKLVELIVERQKIPKKIQNKDKVQTSESVVSPTKNRKILKNQVAYPKNGGSAGLQKLKFLDDYTKYASKSETVMEIDMGDDIFSEGFSEHLHLEHIKEVVVHDWLSASAVIVYARYLYDKLIGPRGLKYKISFLSPHVSFDDIQGKDIARVLMKTKVLKDEKIILAPYNVGIHWVLFVINPDAEVIYFLDPLGGEPSDHGSIKTKFENAIQIYRAWCENKISKSKKDKIKWNKIKGDLREVMSLLDEVGECGLEINGSVVVVMIVNGLCEVGKVSEAMMMLSELRNRGWKPDFMAYWVVAKEFRKMGNVVDEIKVLKMKRKLGVAPRSGDYKEFIFELVSEKRIMEAKMIGEVIVGGNFVVEDDVFNVLIECVSDIDPVGAIVFFDYVVEKERFLSISSLNRLSRNLCRVGKVDELLEVFHVLECKNYFKDVEGYNVMMSWLCEAGRVKEGYAVLQEMKKKGLNPDVSSYNYVMEACCKQDLLRPARKLWDEMFASECCGNLKTYNILIRKFSEEGQVQEAQMLLNRMFDKGIEPDSSSYTFLLQGLCQEDILEEAFELYSKTTKQDITIARDILSSFILSLCKKGHLAAASKLLCSLSPEIGRAEPHIVLLKCLADARQSPIAIEHCRWVQDKSPAMLQDICTGLLASLSVSKCPEPILQFLQRMQV